MKVVVVVVLLLLLLLVVAVGGSGVLDASGRNVSGSGKPRALNFSNNLPK